MKEENLTLYDIQRASTNYLKSCSKYDIDVEVQDMIDKELYIREHRRPIVKCFTFSNAISSPTWIRF